MIAPFYLINTEFKSVLMIRNGAGSPVKVRVNFDSLEGEEIGHRTLELGPHSSVKIDADGVEMREHRFAALGSITLIAKNGTIHGLAARLRIMSRGGDIGSPIEETLQAADEKPHHLNVACVPVPVSVPVLAIHSLSALPQSIFVDCTDAQGESYESQMTVPPGMTFLVNACISSRSESRTYEDILRGNGGDTKGPISIRVKAGQPLGGVAVWGFATTSRAASSVPGTTAIEFVGQAPDCDSARMAAR